MPKRRSTIGTNPKKKTKTQGEKEPGYSTEIDTPDVFLTPKTHPDVIPPSDVDIEEFHTPKSFKEEDLPAEVVDLIQKQRKTGLTEEQQFLTTFNDYSAFIDFIKTNVCSSSSDCFCELMTSMMPTVETESTSLFSFWTNTTVNDLPYFNYSIFTTRAPTGYDLFSAVNPELLRSPNRFYNAMKIILERIPRINPSREKKGTKITLHKYMILLDRLIYFYHIYILYNQHKLKGFSNTAGIVILFHGGYEEYDASKERTIIDVPPPIENLFLCSKATPGCYAYEYTGDEIASSLNKKSYLWLMTNNIKQKGYVNFDEVAFSKETCKERREYRCDANCYLELSRTGNSMEHFITPKTDQYINKYYSRNLNEKYYIVDLQKFDEVRDSPTLSAEEKLKSSCITGTDFIKGRMVKLYTDSIHTGYSLKLSDIMDYVAQVLRKPNVFIYDRSCAVILPMTRYEKRIDPVTKKEYQNIILPEMSLVIPFIEGYTTKGFGISKRRKYKKIKTQKRNKRTKKRNKK
jgi:hypothetical protein